MIQTNDIKMAILKNCFKEMFYFYNWGWNDKSRFTLHAQ